MADPVRTTNLPVALEVTELVVNFDLGGVPSTGRLALAAARQLLMAAVAPPVALVAELSLNWPAGVEARVYGEANPANNGVYLKSGAVGGGAWARIGPIPGADASTKADVARTITGGGLVTGGGDLTVNRVLSVAEATPEQVTEGTSGTVAVTPRRLAPLAAAQAAEALLREKADATAGRQIADTNSRHARMPAFGDAFMTFGDRVSGLIAEWSLKGGLTWHTAERWARDPVWKALSPLFRRTFAIGRFLLVLTTVNNVAVAALDDQGRAFARGANGRFGPPITVRGEVPGSVQIQGTNFTANPSRWLYDWRVVDFGMLAYGQSWAQGGAAIDPLTAAITGYEFDPGFVVMPAIPKGAFYDGQTEYASYVNAKSIELFSSDPPYARNVGEQPIMSMAWQFNARCQATFGVKPRIVVTTVSRGGADLNELSPGSPFVTRLLQGVCNNIRASNFSGKIYELKHIYFPHGESMFQQGYLATLAAYRTIIRVINAEVRLLTGQTYDPIWHVHSPDRNVSSGEVELGTGQRVMHRLQLEGLVRIIGPGIAADQGEDTVGDGHPAIYGDIELGANAGDSAFEAETSHNRMTCTICTHITEYDATSVNAWVSVMPGASLVHDNSGDYMAAYFGPTSGSGAHTAGVWAKDKDGPVGIVSVAVGSAVDGLYPIRLTCHRVYDSASLVVMFGARGTGVVTTWSTQFAPAQALFRASLEIGPWLPAQTRPRWAWMVPSRHTLRERPL